MSTSKKPIRKRKRQSPPPPSTSRLEKFRSRQRNLWHDDEEDEDEPYVQPKPLTTTNKTYIVLTDSDEEKASPQQQPKRNKSKKKSTRTRDESYSSDHDHKITSKCATCLICSILSTLTSYNCCSKHLSVLIHEQNPRSHREKSITNTEQWPPQQVMILPMTDELMQRYLNPQEISRLRTQNSTARKTTESTKSTRKLSKKPTTTSEPSDTEPLTSTKLKSSTKASHVAPEPTTLSSSINESILPTSEVNLPDVTFTVITSTSSTINSFESPNALDTCQLQQSSDQPIIIDDSQSDSQQDKCLSETKQNNPWTPISDETYAAMEVALNRIDQVSEDQTEFTPATARRTPTELMASILPKIQLRKGRFRQGKPITDKNIPDTTTTNECSSSISIIPTSTRPPPSLATIIEDESLILQSPHQTLEKSSHVLSQRQENTTEGLSDTVMSCLFAQDDASQYDNLHPTAKTASHPALPPPAIVIEDYSRENQPNKSVDNSQSSQLTNDHNDTQSWNPSAINEKIVTPSRVSYRLNPDGSRVSISRPVLSTNHPSSLISLHRTSTDVTINTTHTNN